MFSQSTKTLNTTTLAVARKDTLNKFIKSGGVSLQTESLDILNKLRKDSTWLLVELLDANKLTLLHLGNQGVKSKLSVNTIFSELTIQPDSSKIGKIYAAGDSMYYPVVASITSQKQPIGYLVIWRSLSSTKKGLEQLSQLMGPAATFYIGNNDGSLWTNLIVPVKIPKLNSSIDSNLVEYKLNNETKIASFKPIINTQWRVMVEFSKGNILEGATRFLNSIIIIGGILMVIGFIITWFMSRNIIKPLSQLTSAATAIASGDYSVPVEVKRKDELGKLAKAFNTMAEQIRLTQTDLENKVRERTAQLELVNKELDSFSYSVSHDLRAPLRIINGYAQLITEQGNGTLEEEPKRMLANISLNAKRMGYLIDDLLNFSRLGKRELTTHTTDMNSIIQSVIDPQLKQHENYDFRIHKLPNCTCDSSLIKQVWENLISNAVKYSSKQSNPHIEIGSVKENNRIVYYIKDNGVGFDMKYYDKLFDVFQRLHKATEFEGTGVGLALAKRIINKHGGKIWAESKINEGAVFYFTVN